MYLTLTGPLAGYKPETWSFSQGMNSGWLGSLSFAQFLPTRMDALSTITATFYDSKGGSLTTPPMLLRRRGRRRGLPGRGTSYDLVDLTSYKLSAGGESFDTFQDCDASDIVAAIADRFDVVINGAPTFPVWKEDIKVSNGWDPLRRIAVVAGKQLVVNADASVSFVASSWTTSGTFLADSVEEDYSPADQYGKIFVSKNTGQGVSQGPYYFSFDTPGDPSTTLSPPISLAQAFNEGPGSSGRGVHIRFFDADDKLIVYDDLGGGEAPGGIGSYVTDGTWPAVRFQLNIEPDPETDQTDVVIRITGQPANPAPVGIDAAFVATFGTGRGLPVPFSEALIPSLSHATSTWPDWLTELNRGSETLRVGGPIDCSARLGIVYTDPEWDIGGRAEGISWSGSASSPGRTDLQVNVA